MSSRSPYVSVVVPTRHRSRQLLSCLDALARQDYPADRFEVIVIDDSGGATGGCVPDHLGRRLRLTRASQAHAGPAAARNKGAAMALGEFLAFTDDDCLPATNWLSTLVSRVEGAACCGVGGRTINALVDNPYSVASQVLVDYLYSRYCQDSDHAQFLTSNNLMLPTRQFCDVGGFDPRFPAAAGEDRLLCADWLDRGYRLIYVADAIVHHAHDMSLTAFWRQQYNYGCASRLIRKIKGRRDRRRVLPEPMMFYVHLLLFPLNRRWSRSNVSITALVVLSQLAVVSGFLSPVRGHGARTRAKVGQDHT